MNRTRTAVVGRILVGLFSSIFAAAAAAQVGGELSDQGPSSSNNDALALLLDQNQQLRLEVQALRGLVEEQGFEIRKLQRDSLARYTNVDERLSSLESAETASYSAPPNPTDINNQRDSSVIGSSSGVSAAVRDISPNLPSSSSATNSLSADADIGLGVGTSNSSARTPSSLTNRSVTRATLQPAVLSEQQLYQMAYDSVINSNFDRSIAEFDQYLGIYPEGRFVTNAYYWKGQAYLYLNRFNEAKDSYEIILNQYENSAKLADAMYGLGLAYQGLGNIPQARQLLNEIKRRFPNTGVANLADTRLLQLD
ncbi:MAG: tol-pal system protein YbgF [Gammaproteobacteria bacterium]|nr:tol-pal system protein YbgF [Gammaproteobacteria bacterium]